MMAAGERDMEITYVYVSEEIGLCKFNWKSFFREKPRSLCYCTDLETFIISIHK